MRTKAIQLSGETFTYPDFVINSTVGESMPTNVRNSFSIVPALRYVPIGYEATAADSVSGIDMFLDFLQKNPVHVSKINFRAGNQNALPTELIVLNPNVFTGQMDRQVVNVTANITADQFQSGVITVSCDLILSRMSIINFGGVTVTANDFLDMDLTIDAYLSLEKALIDNLLLLQTSTGVSNFASEVISKQVVATPVSSKTEAIEAIKALPISSATPVTSVDYIGETSMTGRTRAAMPLTTPTVSRRR